MTFDWKFYVALADMMAKSPVRSGDTATQTEEIQANYRACLSRAYYGIFGTVYNYLRDVEHDSDLQMWLAINMKTTSYSKQDIDDLKDRTKSIHEYVINRLKTDVHDGRKNNLRRGLRKVLGELKERRVEADYREGAPPFDERTVKLAIKDSYDALRYVSQLCK